MEKTKSKAQVKALALFSGGLDSSLAIKVIQEQGIAVEAITFLTPFYSARAGDFSLKCGGLSASPSMVMEGT